MWPNSFGTGGGTHTHTKPYRRSSLHAIFPQPASRFLREGNRLDDGVWRLLVGGAGVCRSSYLVWELVATLRKGSSGGSVAGSEDRGMGSGGVAGAAEECWLSVGAAVV